MVKMKMNDSKIKLTVVGSIALDTVATCAAKRSDVLGGSVSYACAAASFFKRPGMVGVIGSDFPDEHVELLSRFGIDLAGLQRAAGKTFRWSGVYERDMNVRRTISTELNVFDGFSPRLPDTYRESPFLFLANIAPELQLDVLGQLRSPRFTAVDTMNLWIKTARDSLMKVISKADLLLLNDSEARELTEEDRLPKAAARLLRQGPRYVVIKKGEHGGMLFSDKTIFLVPAYPVSELCDPTGAGDAFAGGMMGMLADARKITDTAVRRAMLAGTVTASFAVESFGLDRLAAVGRSDIDTRISELLHMIRVPAFRPV